MRRAALSRPLRLSLLQEVARPDRTYFDYGCGRGDDIASLVSQGFSAAGWDPAHCPDSPLVRSDVVNVGYVVNVIEDPIERAQAVRNAWDLTRRVLVVSARLENERDEAHVAVARDGWVTRHGTFQKFFTHEELGAWLEATLGEQAVAAAMGVYYVFREGAERESYLASRFRRPAALPKGRVSDKRFADHRDVLDPFIEFVGARGRLPETDELPNGPDVLAAFGTLRQAFRVLLVVTSSEEWERIRVERSIDLLVHLALARFHGRPRWSALAVDLQRDIRAFHSSYRSACEKADKLLFAVGNAESIALNMRASTVGKQTGNALYIHSSALSDLPALLRVYEGCGRAFIGTVEDANVIKLHRGEPKISYLSYPSFDQAAHPILARSVTCDLRERRIRVIRYDSRENRPVLHRKELFVSDSYPRREIFARLTSREESLGLLADSELIGLESGWNDVCARNGVEYRGHAIRRTRST